MYGIKKIIMRYTNMYYTLVLLSPLEWLDLTLSAKAPHGVVWTAGSAQLKALQAPKISRKSINQELITWGISNFFAPNSPPGLPTLGDDSKFQPKIPPQKNMRKMDEDFSASELLEQIMESWRSAGWMIHLL